MSFRKVIPILIFIAGAMLGKPLALGSVGLFTKAFLYFEKGWQFSYGSIDWHEGQLIFKDIDLHEPAVSLHAKRVSVLLGAKYFQIEQPKLAITGMPRLQKGSGDWTFEMKDGTIAGDELGEMRFSFEKTWRHHLGRLVLERQGSRMAVEAIEEDSEIWVDADLHQFETDSLKSWIDIRGVADGRIHLVFQGNTWKRGSAHLDFRNGGYGRIFDGVEGAVDWEGDIGEDLLATSLETGRMRLKLLKAKVRGGKGGIDELKGDFSFTAGVGAKWDFEGQAISMEQDFPFQWSGRAFLHDARPHWVESEAVCLDARILLKGQQEEMGFRWKGEGQKIGAVEGTFLQSLWSLADERAKELEYERGSIDFKGEMLLQNDWNLALKTENLNCRYDRVVLECSDAEIQWSSEKNGFFQFQGVSGNAGLGNGKTISIEEWQGKGEIQNGLLIHSSFEGKLEKLQGAFSALGSFEDFHLEAAGENCEAVLHGAWNERLDFEIDQGKFEGLAFGGSGWVEPNGSFSLHLDHFDGALSPLCRVLGISGEKEGSIQSVGTGFIAEGNLESCEWFLQAKGELGYGLKFYCPFLEKKNLLSFDIRIETPTWDLARFYGTADEGRCEFDPRRTHLLGMPIQVDSCQIDSEGLALMQMKLPVSWKSLMAAAPLWFPEASAWILAPIVGTAKVDLSYVRHEGSAISVEGEDLSWNGEPFSFHCLASEQIGSWHISKLEIDQCKMAFEVQKAGQTLRLTDGSALWKKGLEAVFSGVIDSSFQFEFHLPHLRFELDQVEPIAASLGIPFHGLQGMLEGKGTLSRRGRVEADFDFIASELKASTFNWKNTGPIHLQYASDKGILCSGLDLEGESPTMPYLSCKIDLLEFDALRSLWILNHSHFHLPPKFLDLFPNCPSELKKFNPETEIDFSAEIECPTDFSSFSCFVKEVSVPVDETTYPIQNLLFSFNKTDAETHFEIEHQGYPVKVAVQASLGMEPSGRLVLQDGDRFLGLDERPLSIHWSYSGASGFLIREIEGQFGGIDASFHALDAGTSLIGSARVDFGQMSKIIPSRIAQVFTDLKMGKGYELKGKLFLDKGFSFRGLLTGKQIDLFGYQLRTLLAQFEFDPDKVRIYDLKISDSAGMLKIDELVAAGEGDSPWTISIPHLTILELRPSLLQTPGKESQPAGPLVVRELRIDDFKGLLEDSKTYTATGALAFINSFRREHTVFDIPSDLLGRIVGLDLELLIPACGVLTYELNNGFFHLTSLYNSYSEGQRSEFFLVPEPAPSMDLDGNLHILVSMKQFVIFKLTESFQILIDGKLDDPQFHLQKKRRFLGL